MSSQSLYRPVRHFSLHIYCSFIFWSAYFQRSIRYFPIEKMTEVCYCVTFWVSMVVDFVSYSRVKSWNFRKQIEKKPCVKCCPTDQPLRFKFSHILQLDQVQGAVIWHCKCYRHIFDCVLWPWYLRQQWKSLVLAKWVLAYFVHVCSLTHEILPHFVCFFLISFCNCSK